MEDQKHFIQKQKLIFNFTSEEKATAWNRNASSFYYAEVLPLLNQLFNKHIPSDRFYSIGSLEIDLGKVNRRDIKEILFKRLEAKLTNILTNDKSENILKSIDQGPGKIGIGGRVAVKGNQEQLLEVFYTFLDYGILPWNSNFNGIESLEEAILKEIGIDTLTQLPDFQSRVKQPLTRKRLFYQFSRPFAEQTFRKSLAKEFDIVELFKKFMSQRIQTASIDASSKSIIRKIISEKTLDWIVASESDAADSLLTDIIHATITRIERGLGSKAGVSGKEVGDESILYSLLGFEQQALSVPLYDPVIKLIKSHPSYDRIMQSSKRAKLAVQKGDRDKQLQKTNSDKESLTDKKLPSQDPTGSDSDQYQNRDKSVGHSHFASNEQHTETNEVGRVAIPLSESQDLERTATEGGKKQISAESKNKDFSLTNVAAQEREKSPGARRVLSEYYVLNAGLVLCWPYLKALFDRLGYLEAADFRNEAARERAVHILGYTAAGHDKCEEHELIFQKFLAGWPLQMPLVKELKLLKKEKRECDNMLQSLITNWPILKNTSIEGLRASFFQRSGKLRKEEEAWRLIVEQKSYDMLLDHLSYSIAIIKLPWCKEILKVDWA
jgi:hypothetical protein